MIELLVIRHAIAEDQAASDPADVPGPDFDRHLTDKGKKRMIKASKGLIRVYPELDLIATSPLVRSVETAKILSHAYGDTAFTQLPALAPDAPWDDFLQWLSDQPAGRRIAVIGHEPHLSRWCGWMLCGLQRPFFAFKKGGACLLKVGTPPTAGEAEMVWLMTPRQLREVAK
jgi:phosphohistidine phosphatase